MLRRPPTTLTITTEDVAAYEDRRYREAVRTAERRRAVMAAQAKRMAQIEKERAEEDDEEDEEEGVDYDESGPNHGGEGYEGRDYGDYEEEMLQRQHMEQLMAQAQLQGHHHPHGNPRLVRGDFPPQRQGQGQGQGQSQMSPSQGQSHHVSPAARRDRPQGIPGRRIQGLQERLRAGEEYTEQDTEMLVGSSEDEDEEDDMLTGNQAAAVGSPAGHHLGPGPGPSAVAAGVGANMDGAGDGNLRVRRRQEGRGRGNPQLTPTPAATEAVGGRVARTREERIGIGRRGRGA